MQQAAARERGFALPDVVPWMAHRPARLARLRKWQITVGSDASLVAFAPDKTFTVGAAPLQHRNPMPPYDRRPLTGVVRRTWLRGVDTADRNRAGA